MSLSVWIGGLSECLKSEDQEERSSAKRDLREINRLLVANGLSQHTEPETLPRMRSRYRGVGLPYDWLHYLRRAIAFARQEPDEFTPVPKGADPSEDEHIEHELLVSIESHVICHSDCDGYYVPVDFPDPLYHDSDDEIGGGILGSSQAGMRELLLVAPLINIPIRRGTVSGETIARINNERRGRFYIERQVWLELFEAFRLSIKYGTAVKFN
jgi:hypothetical protein